MWHSVQCSTTSKVYCSVNDNIQNHGGKMNWYSASRYCRKRNSNLSTITTTNKHEINSYGWIGLYRQAENHWTWIGNMSSMYRNWAPGEPLTKDCGSVDRDFKWHSNECSKNMSFVCYDDKLVVVNENKTWEEALTHCKGIKAKCESPKCRLLYNSGRLYNSSYIRERIHKATTDEVWIGLRFLGGRWLWMTEPKLNVSSIQHKLKVQETLPQCPSMANCGALSKHDINDTNNWIIRDCTERRNFVCLKQCLWNGAS
ncbi:hypothetical protein JOB18_030673 [Solea senegalensis]|nr:hypothetical protein JOB18_030673 [Solea senegalensis]